MAMSWSKLADIPRAQASVALQEHGCWRRRGDRGLQVRASGAHLSGGSPGADKPPQPCQARATPGDRPTDWTVQGSTKNGSLAHILPNFFSQPSTKKAPTPNGNPLHPPIHAFPSGSHAGNRMLCRGHR